MRRIRLSSAHGIALLALFIALGTGAYAASTLAPKDSVTSNSIKDGAVRSRDIHNHTITRRDVRAGTFLDAKSQTAVRIRLIDPTADTADKSLPIDKVGPFVVRASCKNEGDNLVTGKVQVYSAAQWTMDSDAEGATTNVGTPAAGTKTLVSRDPTTSPYHISGEFSAEASNSQTWIQGLVALSSVPAAHRCDIAYTRFGP
jgi:hypothetical protein